MKTLKNIAGISLLIFCLIAITVQIAPAAQGKGHGKSFSKAKHGKWAARDMQRRIVVLREGITFEEKQRLFNRLENRGAVILMDLPFMNAVAIEIGGLPKGFALAGDRQVTRVGKGHRSSKPTLVKAATDGGAADGGAGDGGANPYIYYVEAPQTDERPWGTLDLFDHAFDPLFATSFFDFTNLGDVLSDAILSGNMGGIRVAFLDTGVDINHPRLSGKIAGGVDLVDGIQGIPADPNGHGTHVAGTFCAADLGILNRAPIQFHMVRILDTDAIGDVATLAMGLQWSIDNQMDIVSMSVAYMEDSPELRLAVESATAAGITMVSAVGNHSNWDLLAPVDENDNPYYPVMYPAAYSEVIAVGAVDAFGATAAFSNTGPETDVMAPGTDVISTDTGGGFGIANGTSMAVPHVTGAVAMILARARDLEVSLAPVDIETILKETAQNGIIDPASALESIVFGPPVW